MGKSKKENFNKVILLLSLSDIFSWGPFLIVSALSSYYLAIKLGENAVQFVGIGTAIYYVTRASLQFPIGKFTDKMKTDKDEIIILSLGTILMGLPYILYPQITLPFHYYILQFIFGIGVALSLTSWRKLFATNTDNGKEGFQYAFYESLMSISTAILSILIGYFANLGDVYFDVVMVSSGLVMMLASIWVLLIYKVKERKTNNLN